MKKIEALLVVDPYVGENRHTAGNASAGWPSESGPCAGLRDARWQELGCVPPGEANAGREAPLAVVETGIGVPCYLRHETDWQDHGNLALANSPSVADTGDHIRLYLSLLAVGSHLVRKRDPCQCCSGHCVWNVKTLDEGDPVAVRERGVLVVFHQV